MTDPRTTVYEKRPPTRSRAGSAPRPPRVGDTLGSYRLCVEIGGGGMASVFLAQCCARSGVQRFVALKCIRPEFARNPRFIQMFLDEARVAAQIHHPNVCSVLDFDEHHGTYYLAMEFLTGQTLTAVQHQLHTAPDRADPLDRPAIFARILESACEGLHAAHEAVSAGGVPLNVVHRDVSPDNLFVTYDGSVKVMDFGVAYTTDDHETTRTGILKGKCGYLAPEMIAGNKPDRRADVWSLGVVAWEMMTQRKLFDQPTDPAILRAIDEMKISPPSTVRPGLPPLVDELVLRALERDPARRYQTAREFGRLLNRFLVEHRRMVGLAESSDFMRELFPDGIACARQLVKVAGQLDAPVPPRTRSASWKDTPTVADPSTARELARQSARPDRGEPAVLPARPRWFGISTIAALVIAAASSSGAIVACRMNAMHGESGDLSVPAHRDPALSNFTLVATPAGVDASGAVLLRVQLVPKPETAHADSHPRQP